MHTRFVRVTTVLTLLAFLAYPLSPALAATDATLSGQVVARDTNQPLEGARVHIASVRTGEEITALLVDSEGNFTVGGLAAEPVSLGIETAGTLFVSPTPVALEPGMERTVTVSIPSPATLAPAKSDDDDDRKGGWWTNPTTGALSVVFLPILVGGALKALDDDEEDEPVPSPSSPEPSR